HEDRHGSVLVRLRPVHASAVGEHRAARQPVDRHQVADARAMRVYPAQARRTRGEILAVELPGEEGIRRPDLPLDDITVAADGDLELTLEPGMSGERLRHALRRRLEDRAQIARILDMEMQTRCSPAPHPHASPDHLQMLVSCVPRAGMTRATRQLKAYSI